MTLLVMNLYGCLSSLSYLETCELIACASLEKKEDMEMALEKMEYPF